MFNLDVQYRSMYIFNQIRKSDSIVFWHFWHFWGIYHDSPWFLFIDDQPDERMVSWIDHLPFLGLRIRVPRIVQILTADLGIFWWVLAVNFMEEIEEISDFFQILVV